MYCRGITKAALAVMALALFCPSFSLPAAAQIQREDNSSLGQELQLPINKWSHPSASPKAVVVTLHGLIMYGGAFDGLARQLVNQGCVVYAMDFRGQGRWYQPNQKQTLDYDQGEQDLLTLAQTIRMQYPTLPVFYVGESLGADMSIRLAAKHHELVDGLVLSSPAIKRQSFISRRFISDIMRSWATPNKQLDLVPYMKRCVSDDSRVTEEILNDPLVRKNLSVNELLHSCRVVRSTMGYVKKIPADIPVLIIQGSADRTVKANAVVSLLKQLKSNDQTVRWLPQRGHVLLETHYLQPVAIDTVSDWIKEHQGVAEAVSSQPDSAPLTVNTAAVASPTDVP